MSRWTSSGLLARLRPRAPVSLLLAEPASWAPWCAAHPGASVRLWLPARALHLAELDAALPLAPAEWPGHARALFSQYLGGAAQHWPLAVWATPQRRGACLAPGLDAAALHEAAAAHRVRVLSMLPLWVGLLGQALALRPALREAALARLLVVEGAQLTLLELRRGRLHATTPARLDAPQASALATWLADEAVAGPLHAIGHGLAGTLDAAPWQALQPLAQAAPAVAGLSVPAGLDLLPDLWREATPATHGGWGWALAASAAAVLATAGWEAWQAHEALAEPLPQARAVQRPRPAAPAMPAEALAGLNHPWGRVLGAVEAATPGGLHWLALEHAAARPGLRLAGLASDTGQAGAAAALLAAQPHWADVLVSRLQPQAQAGVAFEINARLEPGR